MVYPLLKIWFYFQNIHFKLNFRFYIIGDLKQGIAVISLPNDVFA